MQIKSNFLPTNNYFVSKTLIIAMIKFS